VKVSLLISKNLSKTIFVALSYASFFARTNQVYLIFLNEGAQLIKKNYTIPIEENLKKAIQIQTGINLESINNHSDFIKLLIKKYGIVVKVCNTSTIALNISNRIGDNSNIEEFCELSTIFDISSILSQSDLILQF